MVAFSSSKRFLCRMWHRFVRWVARRDLRWFYRDVLIIGGERIPAVGPVVIVANHPNDLPDVLMGYLTTSRDVHYVATISAATSPLARAVYDGLGVIPVTRIRDARRLLEQGADVAEVNRAAYRRVSQKLAEGGVVAVFPEGGVHPGPELGHFRQGVAKMILQCLDDAPEAALTVLPVGIQYEGFDHPGSDCCTIIGPPCVLRSKDFPQSPQRVSLVTSLLRGGVRRLVREAGSADERLALDEALAAVGASIAQSPDDAFLMATQMSASLGEIWRDRENASLGAASADVERAVQLVERLGGQPRSARDHATVLASISQSENSLVAPTTRLDSLRRGRLWSLALLAPVAAIGGATHAPLWFMVWALAKQVAEGPAHRVARAYLPGIYIALLWYVIIAALATTWLLHNGRSPLFALLLFMLLFRLGDVAAEWRHALASYRLRTKARRLSESERREACRTYERLRDFSNSRCVEQLPQALPTVRVVA